MAETGPAVSLLTRGRGFDLLLPQLFVCVGFVVALSAYYQKLSRRLYTQHLFINTRHRPNG